MYVMSDWFVLFGNEWISGEGGLVKEKYEEGGWIEEAGLKEGLV